MRTAILPLLLVIASGAAAETPPNLGLAEHNFFYAGEQKQHWMFIVRGGKVVWSYIDAGSNESTQIQVFEAAARLVMTLRRRSGLKLVE